MPGKHTARRKKTNQRVAGSERKLLVQKDDAQLGKAGEAALPRPKTAWATPRENMSRMAYGARKQHPGGFVERRKRGIKDLGTVTVSASAAKGIDARTWQVLSIDEYHAIVKADAAAPALGAPKKFSRSGLTAAMKPVSDGDALAKLRAGKKPVAAKALATGYGKVSGGGALKAPNRAGDFDLSLSVFDLNRAMEAMAPPAKASPPKVYLPGVHNPKSPVRGQMGIKKLGNKPVAAKSGPTIAASMRSSAVSRQAPPVLDAGGAALLANALSDPTLKKSRNVVHKSRGDTAMAKTNFNDLFKSELGVANDDVLVDCPHCEAPITKSDLAKAAGHKGKGAITHVSGPKEVEGDAHIAKQNPHGGTMRGGDGHGVHTSSRGVPGAKKTDAAVGVQNSRGSKHTKKAVSGESSDDDSSDDGSSEAPAEKKPGMKKSIIVRGTDHVQYVDDGSDAAVADMIAKGALGGTPPTQPLDLNNDLTRLLY